MEPENAMALVKAIRFLLTHPDERIAMGQSGRQFAENNYSRKILAEKYVRLIESHLSLKQKGS